MTNVVNEQTIFKVLFTDGSPNNGGRGGTWNLPSKDNLTPGEWMPRIEGDLILCENGYHLCKGPQILEWLGPRLFEAEYEASTLYSIVSESDKFVVKEVRLLKEFSDTWNERTQRLFTQKRHSYEQSKTHYFFFNDVHLRCSPSS